MKLENIMLLPAVLLVCYMIHAFVSEAISEGTELSSTRARVRSLYNDKSQMSVFNQMLKNRRARRSFKEPLIAIPNKFIAEYEKTGLTMEPETFYLIWIAVTVVSAILGFLFFHHQWYMFFASGFAGFRLVRWFFNRKKNKRLNMMDEQLVNVLLMIRNGVQSGLSFFQAMKSSSEHMPEPLAGEFRRAFMEMDMGVAQEDALKHIYDRTGSDDIKLLVAAVAISKRTGGDLGDILNTIVNSVKMRVAIRREVASYTAQGKLSTKIITMIPFILIVAFCVINPSVEMLLFTDDRGMLMFEFMLLWMHIGTRVIYKVIDIEL